MISSWKPGWNFLHLEGAVEQVLLWQRRTYAVSLCLKVTPICTQLMTPYLCVADRLYLETVSIYLLVWVMGRVGALSEECVVLCLCFMSRLTEGSVNTVRWRRGKRPSIFILFFLRIAWSWSVSHQTIKAVIPPSRAGGRFT